MVEVDPYRLSHALRCAEPFLHFDHALKLTIGPDGLTIETREPGAPRAVVRSAAGRCEAEVSAAFDPRYLLDFLDATGGPGVNGPVTLELNGPDEAAVLRAGDRYQCVLMPVYAD